MTNQTPLTAEATVETPEYVEVETTNSAIGTPRVLVSVELIAYVALILLSLALRLPDLGVFPLNDQEAHEALAVFRAVDPRAVGSPLVAQNPLMFTVNMITMSIIGAETASARILTAILGVLLVCSPALFRRWLGRANAFIVAALLALSPVLLVASRSMSGAVWSIALAIGAVYAVGQFAESRRATYAIAATTLLLMLVLMAESAGFLTFFGLVIGLFFAYSSIDDPDRYYRRSIFQVLADWPWLRSLVVGGAIAALLATVFLTYPQGLSGIGNVLDRALRGFVARPAGYPFAYPLLISLVYEPLLWIFGLAGAYFTMTQAGDFLRRALVGWLIASVVWSITYAGAEPGHALWLTLPLAGLSAVAVERALSPVRDRFWNVPTWGPWVHGLAVAATLAIAGINLLAVGRMVMNALPDTVPGLQRPMQLLMVAPASLLVVITFFLVGSMWGARAAWKGLAIGVLIVLGAYSLSVGWRAAVINGDDPREPLRLRPAARNLNLMVETLKTASLRATGAPYDMPLVVQRNSSPENGALDWMLRRFYYAEYVMELAPTLSAPVVVAPRTDQPPKLGAAYVGQDFPVYFTWNGRTLGWDFLTWLYARETRVPPVGDQYVVTWVRSDIYGVDSFTPDAR